MEANVEMGYTVPMENEISGTDRFWDLATSFWRPAKIPKP